MGTTICYSSPAGAGRLATLDLAGGAANGVISTSEAGLPFFGRPNEADEIDGGAGADTLSGNNGDDLLAGGLKQDALYGQRGDDELFGGGVDDRMVGGQGTDNLTGGGGNDKFVFRPDHGRLDQITDFEIGADRIVLKGGVVAFRDLQITGETDTLVTRAPDDQILLLGAAAADLSTSDLLVPNA